MDIFSAGNSDTVIEADYQLFTCSVDGWLESPESPRDIEASKGRKLRQGSISPLLAGSSSSRMSASGRLLSLLIGRAQLVPGSSVLGRRASDVATLKGQACPFPY